MVQNARKLTMIFAAGLMATLLSVLNVSAAENLFKIQNATLTELAEGDTGGVSVFDEQSIASDITFHKVGDTAKYTITLKNTDQAPHVIDSITDDNSDQYITYDYAFTLISRSRLERALI